MEKQLTVAQQMAKTIEGLEGKISEVYTGNGKVSTFIRHCTVAVSKNEKLLACDRSTLFMAIMDAAKSGLNPDGIEGVFKPYGRTVTFEPMYHGLAKRSGWKHYKAFVVREKDVFEYEDTSSGCTYKFSKARGDRGEFEMAVCWSIHSDGFESMSVVAFDMMKSIEDKAKQKNPLWKTKREAMWTKTAVKQHAKYQVHEDMSIIDEINDDDQDIELDITPTAKVSRIEMLKAQETVNPETGEIA